MLDIAQKQKDLSLKAQEKPYQRIGALFPMICQKEWMLQAMWNVLHNQGAETAGVDGEIKARYYDAKTNVLTSKAMKQVEEICESLECGTYRPKPVKRIYIPKANGKMRPIGIPTLADRTVQEAVRMVIEPIYENDFLSCSYGFRPNRCTMDAVSVFTRIMQPQMKYYWVIEGDIKGCFD
jgi:retron-type reverse transcriptase